jgi:hypothetical protein
MTRGIARVAMSEAVALPGGSDTDTLSLRKYVVQRTHDGRRMAKQDDRAGGEPSAGGEDAAPRAAGKRRAQDTDMNERAGKAQDRRGEAQGSSSGVQEAPQSHESAASRDESSQRPPKRRCVIMTENYAEKRARAPNKPKVTYIEGTQERKRKREAIQVGAATIERTVGERYEWRDAGLPKRPKRLF